MTPEDLDAIEQRIASKAAFSDLIETAALIEDGEALCAALRAAWDDNARLRAALEEFIDDEPCLLDHEGYCQAHYVTTPCIVANARAALARPAVPPC